MPRWSSWVTTSYRVQCAGRQAMVTVPEPIEVSNTGQVRQELLTVINRGAATLIADMTARMNRGNARSWA